MHGDTISTGKGLSIRERDREPSNCEGGKQRRGHGHGIGRRFMRVLLIGGGGREHALAWKIAQSPQVEELICAPGNAGIAGEPKTTCVPVGGGDLSGLMTLARERKPDLVVVGPAGYGDRGEDE